GGSARNQLGDGRFAGKGEELLIHRVEEPAESRDGEDEPVIACEPSPPGRPGACCTFKFDTFRHCESRLDRRFSMIGISRYKACFAARLEWRLGMAADCSPRIGFLGAGKMATALARGWLAAGLVRSEGL